MQVLKLSRKFLGNLWLHYYKKPTIIAIDAFLTGH